MEFEKGQKFRVINAKGLNASLKHAGDYFTDGQILEFEKYNSNHNKGVFVDVRYVLLRDEIEKFLEVVEDSFHYMVVYSFTSVRHLTPGTGRTFIERNKELDTRESIEELENDIMTRNSHEGVLITNIIELRG